jgi:hypothetical protein
MESLRQPLLSNPKSPSCGFLRRTQPMCDPPYYSRNKYPALTPLGIHKRNNRKYICDKCNTTNYSGDVLSRAVDGVTGAETKEQLEEELQFWQRQEDKKKLRALAELGLAGKRSKRAQRRSRRRRSVKRSRGKKTT